MVGKSHRFHGYGSLNRVYKQAQKVTGAQLTLKYTPNPKRSTYRIAVVVSKKVSKSAVTRNRIRRRIYEQIRLLENQISGSFDLVFIVYGSDLVDLPPNKLHDLIQSLLIKSQVVPKNQSAHDIVSER